MLHSISNKQKGVFLVRFGICSNSFAIFMNRRTFTGDTTQLGRRTCLGPLVFRKCTRTLWGFWSWLLRVIEILKKKIKFLYTIILGRCCRYSRFSHSYYSIIQKYNEIFINLSLMRNNQQNQFFCPVYVVQWACSSIDLARFQLPPAYKVSAPFSRPRECLQQALRRRTDGHP